MSSDTNLLFAAQNLKGVELKSGWRVISDIPRHTCDTGGYFSVCYEVINSDGKRAFMKVLNLARAFSMEGDQLKNIQSLIEQFNFERDILDICNKYRFRRVACAIEHGKHEIQGNPFGIYYIIFEFAEGDIRKQLRKLENIDYAWLLRTAHQTAVGLHQMHRKRIAHQDLKPSNVLLFANDGAKIADLGCADIEGEKSPRGTLHIAGDHSYAPPELLYGEVPPSWEIRRLGTDMYLFGSLITFVFAQVQMTAALCNNLHPRHRPGFWPHDYRSVLPYVRNSYGYVLENIEKALPNEYAQELIWLIKRLCDPDPKTRGHEKDLDSNQFDLQRFVSVLNRIAFKAEIKIR